ncbi:hypothetical protein BH11MYX1_BH11MYX1_12160 [soil metagenome]
MTKFAAFVFLLAACTHDAKVNGLGVTFHGGQLNGTPVKVDRFTVQNTTFVVEHSIFIYEHGDPFRSWQLALSVALEDPHRTWNPSVEERKQFADIWFGLFARRLDASKPGHPNPALCTGPTLAGEEWQMACSVTVGSTAAHLRARVIAAPNGVFVQEASWASDKGKEWTDKFWSSLRAPTTPGAVAAAPLGVPIDQVVAQAGQLALR